MRQKILCLALVLVLLHLHALNIGLLSHFSFTKTLFPSFLHLASNSHIPPTLSFRECFSLLVVCQVHNALGVWSIFVIGFRTVGKKKSMDPIIQ